MIQIVIQSRRQFFGVGAYIIESHHKALLHQDAHQNMFRSDVFVAHRFRQIAGPIQCLLAIISLFHVV